VAYREHRGLLLYSQMKKYIVGYEDGFGRMIPLGFSKVLDHAKVIARRHKLKIYVLKEYKGVH